MKNKIFLIIVSMMIGYSIGNAGNNYNEANQEQKMQESSTEQVLRNFFTASNENLFYPLEISVAPEFESTKFDAGLVHSLPEPPNSVFPEGKISGLKPFSKEHEDVHFSISTFKEREVDIDDDGTLEKIVFFSTGVGSSIPQVMQIVKNDTVIFEDEGSSLGFEETQGEPGFILTTRIHQNNSGVRVRYIIDENGVIKPLWQQRFAGFSL